MSPQEGVREALALPGLTPTAEMALSIRCGRAGVCMSSVCVCVCVCIVCVYSVCV